MEIIGIEKVLWYLFEIKSVTNRAPFCLPQACIIHNAQIRDSTRQQLSEFLRSYQQNAHIWILTLYASRAEFYLMSGEMLERRLSNADEILLGLEHILGREVMKALHDRLNYEYFGIEDIAQVIETRPDIFERAMKEILGSAGPALISRARIWNAKG